jgi:hypothetical protein
MREQRVYYKIRFPAKAGTFGEWHQSNNGTNAWGTEAKIRAVLTRGIQSGYKGKTHTPFSDYEVVRFTETVEIEREVVTL